MHVCVFCMKYETGDFLANPLICLKQCRQNGNCPHIFPLKVTKGREGGIGDRKTHALSAVTYMPCSQAATYTRTSLLDKFSSFFSAAHCWSSPCVCAPSAALCV